MASAVGVTLMLALRCYHQPAGATEVNATIPLFTAATKPTHAGAAPLVWPCCCSPPMRWPARAG
ncbi:hypothetical protein [Novosphingobium sp.]|uniref:hypothetical protein n=1 Tax=Novosphingobium sp. TaxID=1874826 RepID=UPI003BAC28E0